MVARFKLRHPNLLLRTIEGIDGDRYLNICRVVVSRFYDTLSSVYEKNSYPLDHIWNCDETRLQARRNCGMQVKLPREGAGMCQKSRLREVSG